MRTRTINDLWIAAALLALSPLTAFSADPPGILSHQGRIAISGTNYHGTGYFKFSLVKDAGGTESILWHHDATALGTMEPAGEVAVTVNKGHYSVLLGEAPGMTAIDSSVFADNDNVSLRIWFSATSGGSFLKLAPDRRITTVGYAMVAKTAESAATALTANIANSVAPAAITRSMLSPELLSALGVDFEIEFVTIGNPGNPDDSTGYGGVSSEFKISKYEITNAQYMEFLHAVAVVDDPKGLFNPQMEQPVGGITRIASSPATTYEIKPYAANKPVNWVSFWDGCRFCNWLHNGKPSGSQGPTTTEDGAYDLTNQTAIDNNTVTRKPGAKFFIPSEDEWDKAAYHHPLADGGDADDYWLYPTRKNSAPLIANCDGTGSISNDSGNIANYGFGCDWDGRNGNLTTVGSGGPGSAGHYGAIDLAGNVWEWNEAKPSNPLNRGLRGGAYENPENELRSTFRYSQTAAWQGVGLGFRIACPAP